jgi:Cu-Zn family superoxide dismutase
MKHLKLGVVGLAVVAASGAFCAAQAQFGGGPTDPPAQFQAMVIDPSGTTLGPAGLWASPQGVQVTMRVEFLRPGMHAVKVNSVGKCDGPSFGAVGAPVANGPNISINGNGFGFVDFLISGTTLDSLMDGDGASITIEDADGKIACGVFKKPVSLAPRAAPRQRPQQ